MKVGRLVALLVALGLLGTVALAQKQRKKGGKESSEQRLVPLTDDQAVDLCISEMLAAWQIGDVEMLHKYYAEDVTVVSGMWEPPLLGWTNFVAAYRRQRERIHAPRLDRQNTALRVDGNVAWAAYQWQFIADVDGKVATAHGHTTLVLEKRGGRWLIVHNHTSVVPELPPATHPAAEPQPAKPPTGAG